MSCTPGKPGGMARGRSRNLQYPVSRRLRSYGRCPVAPYPKAVLLCHSQRIGNDENPLVKLTAERPFLDPDKAALRLLKHARAFEPIQDGRIYIEKLNGPFLFIDKGSPAEYTAGLELAIERSRSLTITERSMGSSRSARSCRSLPRPTMPMSPNAPIRRSSPRERSRSRKPWQQSIMAAAAIATSVGVVFA
jgi:hypothetical protein